MDATAGELERGAIEVAGVRRTYWLVRAPRRQGQGATAPLLIVLHGSGMDGRSMARFTGLAGRRPGTGVTIVFPDGWQGLWHPLRPPVREPALDDARFLAELSSHLEGEGAARSWPVFLAGVSNGARFAEHVARHALLPVAGLFLVAASALEASRRLAPVPQLRTTVIMMMGTGDRTTPYDGGPLTRRGLSGLVLKRRAVRHGELPGEEVVPPTEDVAADWAAGNGITSGPAAQDLPAQPDDPPVTLLTWTAPGCHPVQLYRIEGGGHGWPGGPQHLPKRVFGPIPRHLDATGLLLGMAEREGGPAANRILGPGSPVLTPGQNHRGEFGIENGAEVHTIIRAAGLAGRYGRNVRVGVECWAGRSAGAAGRPVGGCGGPAGQRVRRGGRSAGAAGRPVSGCGAGPCGCRGR